MRITNKVMQNNALVNINRNKETQDALNNQLATGKKVNRPSEDPIVAIRALRLRSDVDQVSQYLKKNVPDAVSWLQLTEGALKTTVSVLNDMIEKCESGASDQLKTEDRKVIIDSLNELYKEVYNTGDSDYAGRYIFTGYRTDTSLSFGTQTKQQYQITEAFDCSKLEAMTYIDTAGADDFELTDLSETKYQNTAGDGPAVTENDITSVEYFRFRLAYDNLDKVQTDADDDTLLPDNISLKVGTTDYPVTVLDDPAAAYSGMEAAPDSVVLIPSTGELLLGKNVYDAMQKPGETFTISYSKSEWKSTDLRPQHYFNALTKDTEGKTIEYNPDYPTNRTIGQAIEYQVGFNQSIQVNTYAEDVYQHAIGRDVGEITDLANKLTDIENIKAKLEEMSKDADQYSEEERKTIALNLEAVEKAETLTKDQLQKRFSSYITKMQSYMNDADEALTVVGNRSARVALIENRLTDQKETFDNLKSDNEDADETEVAVQLSSAQVSYEAALMATSDMIKTTLLNYL